MRDFRGRQGRRAEREYRGHARRPDRGLRSPWGDGRSLPGMTDSPRLAAPPHQLRPTWPAVPQVWPKSCGHVGRKQVVHRDEAVARIRAACDARWGPSCRVVEGLPGAACLPGRRGP